MAKYLANLIVLDLDGAGGYPAFAATFPPLAETYTVASGGGVGKHVYFYTDSLPPSVKAMGTPIGNLELCGEGRQAAQAFGHNVNTLQHHHRRANKELAQI